MSDWAVGLSTGCFYQTSILNCLPAICHGGFTQLEICSFPTHLDYHDAEAVERAAKVMREYGLEPYSFHAPYGAEIVITSLDEERRHRSQLEVLRAAEAAARLEAWYLVIHPGPESAWQPPSPERLQRLNNAVSVLDRVSQRCQELGVGLVLENMLPHLLFGNASDMLWMMGALTRADVGICLDTGHAHLAQDSAEIVPRFAGHLRLVHANDNNGRYDDHLPPGEGAIDWHRVLTQLEDQRFAGGLILEIAADSKKTAAELLASARAARRRLRDLARRIGRGERSPTTPAA